MRLGWVALSSAVAIGPGCYLAHDRGAEGGACDLPRISPIGLSCATLGYERLPDAVCELDDGSHVAMSFGARQVFCAPRPDGAGYQLLEDCTDVGRAHRSVWCGELGAAVFGDHTFDLGRAQCAVLERRVPAGPWEPIEGVARVCDDPDASCGSPVVLQIELRAEDDCGGLAFVQRCDARVAGSRIELSFETAPTPPPSCEAIAPVPRRVACVVAPLGEPGAYEVVDGSGRLLAVLDIPESRALPRRETRCIDP